MKQYIRIIDGDKFYFLDAEEAKRGLGGKLHHLDGPAVEGVYGSKSWYVNGKYLTEEEFNKHPLVMQRKSIEAWK